MSIPSSHSTAYAEAAKLYGPLIANEVAAIARLADTPAARRARDRATIARMAQTMASIADLTGGCSDQDLLRCFKPADVERFFVRARDLAAALRPAIAEAG